MHDVALVAAVSGNFLKVCYFKSQRVIKNSNC